MLIEVIIIYSSVMFSNSVRKVVFIFANISTFDVYLTKN